MIRRPPRSTQSRSSAASDVYKRQVYDTLSDEIQQYQPFKMEYLPRKKMFVDTLSRHPVSAVSPAQPDPVQRFLSDGELRKLQDRDPLLGPAIGVHLNRVPHPFHQQSQILYPTLSYVTMSSATRPLKVQRLLFPKPFANYCCTIHTTWQGTSATRTSWTSSAVGICLLYTSPSPRDS